MRRRASAAGHGDRSPRGLVTGNAVVAAAISELSVHASVQLCGIFIVWKSYRYWCGEVRRQEGHIVVALQNRKNQTNEPSLRRARTPLHTHTTTQPITSLIPFQSSLGLVSHTTRVGTICSRKINPRSSCTAHHTIQNMHTY